MKPFQCSKIVRSYDKPERNKLNELILKRKALKNLDTVFFGEEATPELISAQ